MEKREKLDAVFREREARKKQTQMKWTRKEETNFYRIVSTYGIEFDRHKGRYIWDKFRVMAHLDKKTDEQLTEYFISFYHMCLRVCRKIKEEGWLFGISEWLFTLWINLPFTMLNLKMMYTPD